MGWETSCCFQAYSPASRSIVQQNYQANYLAKLPSKPVAGAQKDRRSRGNDLLLDTHGGYCLALQSLELSGGKFGLQVSHDAVSILHHALSLLLQHGDARGAALGVLYNAQVGKCSCPAVTAHFISCQISTCLQAGGVTCLTS